MLGRDTKWRQGNLLADAHADALGLADIRHSRKRVVLITHDCDLPHEKEEFVEIIVGSIAPAADPALANAKNPRKLHLTFISSDGGVLHIELRHTDRRQIPMVEFAKIEYGEPEFALSAEGKRTLKHWLAARYGRPAFPSAFERRLRKHVGNRTVEKQIEKLLKPASAQLVGLFFDLGEERSTELPEGTPYYLSVSVVYDAVEGGQQAREVAEKASAAFRSLFDRAYGSSDTALEIGLDACTPVADTSMTLADIRKVDQWHLEYNSLGENPDGDFLPTGALTA